MTDNILMHFAEILAAISTTERRAKTKASVEALLRATGEDPSASTWLCGPGPRFHVPGGSAIAQRAERMSAAARAFAPQRAITNSKFFWLQWDDGDDGGLSTLSLAAEETGVSEASFRVRHSLAKQRLRFEASNPWTGRYGGVITEPLDAQPLDKRAAMAEAEARIVRVRALRATPKRRRGAY